MLVEKIEGSSLILVNDSYTGLKLDCNAVYTVSCTVKVIDEKTFSYVTASETLNAVIKKYIDLCFGICFSEVYPDGAEYERLLTDVQKVNDIIKEKTADILETNGISIEELSIVNINIGENEKNMIEKMHKMKAGLDMHMPAKSVENAEWICTCGKKNSGKFCTECGSPRDKKPSQTVPANSNPINMGMPMGMGMGMSMGMNMGMGMGMAMPVNNIPMPSIQNSEPVNIFPDDEDLKVMLDCYYKVGPLPAGDRYSETVLYYDKKNDSYQIHMYTDDCTYSTHRGYYTTKEYAERVMDSFDAEAVAKCENADFGMGGGIRVFKFRNSNDELVRAECGHQTAKDAYRIVSEMLNAAAINENRIVPEYAKSWKKFVVRSTGMSMTSCYNYEVEKNDSGDVKVMGSCFINGGKHELTDWRELTEEEKTELGRIPLGLMISKTATGQNALRKSAPDAIMMDGTSCECIITYGDDKTDVKLPDTALLSEFDALMKKVFARN